MSDSVTKRQPPMIDIGELEKELGRPQSFHREEVEPITELLRAIGRQNESQKVDRDLKALQALKTPKLVSDSIVRGDFAAIEAGLLGAQRLEIALRPEVVSKAGPKKPIAPQFGSDFAAIEAGLWSATRKTGEKSSDVALAKGFPTVDLGAERWLPPGQPAGNGGSLAETQIRSRRPVYVLGAIVFAGIAGMVASYGFRSDVSGESEIATIESERDLTTLHVATESPAQNAAILRAVERAPRVTETEQIVQALPPQDQAQPVVASMEPQAPVETEMAAGTATPDPSPVLTEAAAAPPNRQEENRADLARPNEALLLDATPISKDPPQLTVDQAPPAQIQPSAEAASVAHSAGPEPIKASSKQADGAAAHITPAVKNAPAQAKARPPAAHPVATAKTRTPKPAVHMAKAPKPAAPRQEAVRPQPQQIASKSETLSVSPPPESMPVAEPKAEAPAPQQNFASNGAFGLVQNAVNSLTTTTSKLLQWGKNETGIH